MVQLDRTIWVVGSAIYSGRAVAYVFILRDLTYARYSQTNLSGDQNAIKRDVLQPVIYSTLFPLGGGVFIRIHTHLTVPLQGCSHDIRPRLVGLVDDAVFLACLSHNRSNVM